MRQSCTKSDKVHVGCRKGWTDGLNNNSFTRDSSAKYFQGKQFTRVTIVCCIKSSRLIRNLSFLECTLRGFSSLTLQPEFSSHLDTGRGMPVSVFYPCSAPSAAHSRSHSSARLSRTPASPASASRWHHSDCLCLRSATAMRNTATRWHRNTTDLRFHATRQIRRKITHLTDLFSFL